MRRFAMDNERPHKFSEDEVGEIVGAARPTRNVEERGLFAGILCARCRRGQVYRRRGKLDVTVLCSVGDLSIAVPPDIVECSGFSDKSEVSLYDLAEQALRISNERPAFNDRAYL
jgi:hypothetical protein